MKVLFNMSESQLVSHLIKGDELAFERLYFLYIGKVRAFLYKMRLSDQTEDIIQETFISLWEKRQNINENKSFENYLFTIAKNHALKALKKKLRFELTLETELNSSTSTDNPFELLLLEELQISLKKSIEKLPERPRQVFKMKRFGDLSIDQIAKELNISKSTVENHMNRALTAIRKDLFVSSSILFVISKIIVLSN